MLDLPLYRTNQGWNFSIHSYTAVDITLACTKHPLQFQHKSRQGLNKEYNNFFFNILASFRTAQSLPEKSSLLVIITKYVFPIRE